MKILRRYHSTIYGNYRKAYLLSGLVAGAIISLVFLLMWLLRVDEERFQPCDVIIEVLCAVAIAFAANRYRKSLPNQRVTFKELALFGLGMGAVTALVYGLLLWLMGGVLVPDIVANFASSRIAVMPPASEGAEAKMALDAVAAYSAGDWAFIGAFRLAVWSVLVAFLSALLLRTEKVEPNQ